MNTKTNPKNTRFIIQPKLPAPNSSYSTDSATFEVYRVKDLYNKKWLHPGLHKLVGVARTSYHRYGTRSLFDRYDRKAVIYLARAQYYRKNRRDRINEWLSVRMVPGNGEFNGVGELELYTFGNISVVELLRQKMKCSKHKFWRSIISDSRMCGIHPYIIEEDKIVPTSSERHMYTPECMALIQLQFMIDYPPDTLPFRYVSAIIRPEIRDKVVTLRKEGRITKPKFISAHKTLGLSSNKQIVVDRSSYTYNFPRYWLNMNELKSLLYRLLDKKKLTKKTFRWYLNKHSLESLNGELELARMLTAKGSLVGSPLTGEKLRLLIDKHVSDAPELQIIPINIWRSGFLNLLKAARINIFKD